MENTTNLNTKPNLKKRMTAGLIDYSIILSYMGIMFHYYAEPNGENQYVLNGFPGFSIMIVWFFFTVVLEQTLGATLGNKVCNLQPKSKLDPSKSLTFGQSFKRHLLDVIDLWPFGILAIIMIKNTQFNQRLGDLWAKTIVIDLSDPEQEIK